MKTLMKTLMKITNRMFQHKLYRTEQPPPPPTFQDDDDLQVLGAQRLGRDLVQRAPSLDGVADDERRHQEDAVAPQRVLNLDVQLGHGDDLALGRHRAADHLRDKAEVSGAARPSRPSRPSTGPRPERTTSPAAARWPR